MTEDVNPQFWAEALNAFPDEDPYGEMLLGAVIKEHAMGAELRLLPQIRLSVQSEGVMLNRHVHLTDCPPGAVYALEWQRSPETTGNIYTSGWTTRRLFALYDANAEPLSSFVLDDADTMDAGEPGRLVCLPHDEAL